MTTQEHAAHLAREARGFRAIIKGAEGVEEALQRASGTPPALLDGRTRQGRESDLHKLILAECGRRNLLAFHGSTAHRTHRTEGEPDFVILLPNGRLLLVECKTHTGRLSDPQIEVMTRAALLQHRIYVVRSFPDFHSVLRTALDAGEASLHQSHEVSPQA